MKKLKEKIIYGSAGATGGMAGLAVISRCGGGNCSACFGCAAAGLVIIITIIAGSIKGKKEKRDGSIQRVD